VPLRGHSREIILPYIMHEKYILHSSRLFIRPVLNGVVTTQLCVFVDYLEALISIDGYTRAWFFSVKA